MYPIEFDAFKQAMERLSAVFGKTLTDDLLQTYWQAMRDLPLSTIEAGAQRAARYGKFFPKPVELRPKEQQEVVLTGETADEVHRRIEAACRKMDEWRMLDPINFALEWNVQFFERKLVAAFTENDATRYREAGIQLAYWLELQRPPLDALPEERLTHGCKVREALPTFAAEERMTIEQRRERMKLIREARARGVKADQVQFPTP